ncbi:MAG TPA: oligosaccharide flippase family protein [Lacibacter sp.]|nr:oligosaccharide flippase family protein [Lacibacter sp.]
MSSIKQLAGQTFWYGASSIFGRFLNYLLTPLLATIFASADYGKITTLFAIAAFLNIIYTYGMETAYFRFSSKQSEADVYNTGLSSLLLTTTLLTAVLWALSPQLAAFLELPGHLEYVHWVIAIVALDTLAVLPFSKLRFSGRPRKFAFIKILNILVNIGLILFFLVVCKNADPGSLFYGWYNANIGLGYVILANLAASALTLLLLAGEWRAFRFRINRPFWKELMLYSWPLIIVGFGGMVNEMIDRFMILKLYPGTSEEAYSQSGIYGANYKLAVLIVLFIQAFRLEAKPFFFKQSTQEQAPRLYARVMKFFVIACCCCFLGVVLFLDIWKYFMGRTHPEYWTGLHVVPILLLAKLFLGVYYNLSVWYKLTNRNLTGAWITLGGAVLTMLINFLLIPVLGYLACAIATFVCYGFMMVISYRLGQRYYPVPYAWRKLTAYVVVSVLLFGVHQLGGWLYEPHWFRHLLGLLLGGAFLLLVARVERKELALLPMVGRYFK